MVLSFAGLQFTSEHMALGTDAEVLHNEIGLSNIRYRNNTVDIYLRKETDTALPEMYVKRRQLKKFSEPLYACEVIYHFFIYFTTYVLFLKGRMHSTARSTID